MIKRLSRISAIVAGMLALAVWCGAVDFSATTTTKTGKMTMTGKVYRHGNRLREDSNLGGTKRAVIVRPDKNVSYVVNFSEKTYMEMLQMPGTNMGKIFDPALLKQYGTLKKMGSEKISGFVCDKMRFTPKMKPMGVATYWVSRDLQWPLKIVNATPGGGSLVMETKDIKIGPVPAALFNLPKGFKKQAMPKMPPPHGTPKGMPAKPR